MDHLLPHLPRSQYHHGGPGRWRDRFALQSDDCSDRRHRRTDLHNQHRGAARGPRADCLDWSHLRDRGRACGHGKFHGDSIRFRRAAAERRAGSEHHRQRSPARAQRFDRYGHQCGQWYVLGFDQPERRSQVPFSIRTRTTTRSRRPQRPRLQSISTRTSTAARSIQSLKSWMRTEPDWRPAYPRPSLLRATHDDEMDTVDHDSFLQIRVSGATTIYVHVVDWGSNARPDKFYDIVISGVN